MAEYLGILVETGAEIFLGGVGGRIKGYIHELELDLAGRRFLYPIVFSHEYFVSFNLLGRQEFFHKFKITFEEKRRFLKLE